MQWLSNSLYADLPYPFWLIFLFIGAAIGSFYNVLALRWGAVHKANLTGDRNQATLPLMAGRSHCPTCHQQIPLYHNVPLASWLLLRGKSACCNTSISPIYLAFEAWGAITFLFIALTIGPTVAGLCAATFMMSLTLAIRLYLREGFVPIGLLITLTVLAALYSMSPPGIQAVEALPYAVFMAGGASIVLATGPGKRLSMHNHDIALLGISGLTLGPWALSVALSAIVWASAGKVPGKHLSIIRKYDFTVAFGVLSIIALSALVIVAGMKP